MEKKTEAIALRYRFLRRGLKSDHADFQWTLGEWQKIKGKLVICRNGFHVSVEPFDALTYAAGEILVQVEVRGNSILGYSEECWEEVRVIKAWEWTKEDSVALAVQAASIALPIYEKSNRGGSTAPREAIAIARRWLEDHAAITNATIYTATQSAYAASRSLLQRGVKHARRAADAANAAAHATEAIIGGGANYAAYAACCAAYAADYAACTNNTISSFNSWMRERLLSKTKLRFQGD